MEIKEEWKPVTGYEGYYEVSNLGRVKSLERLLHRGGGRGDKIEPPRFMTIMKNHWGYNIVALSKDGKQRRFMLHRLVAMAFIGEPPVGFNQINHKDGNKDNNTPQNLEWCNNAMNQKHAWQLGLNHSTDKLKVKIVQMDDSENVIQIWKGIQEASRVLKLSAGHIWACLVGRRKHCGGFKWKYYEIQ